MQADAYADHDICSIEASLNQDLSDINRLYAHAKPLMKLYNPGDYNWNLTLFCEVQGYLKILKV